MLRITAPFDGMTWNDLRAFVTLNEFRPGDDLVGIAFDDWTETAVGLEEQVPTDEVVKNSDG